MGWQPGEDLTGNITRLIQEKLGRVSEGENQSKPIHFVDKNCKREFTKHALHFVCLFCRPKES